MTSMGSKKLRASRNGVTQISNYVAALEGDPSRGRRGDSISSLWAYSASVVRSRWPSSTHFNPSYKLSSSPASKTFHRSSKRTDSFPTVIVNGNG